MSNNQARISIEETRKIGLFNLVTRKVTSRYSWVEAQKEGVTERENQRCKAYVNQLFNEVRNQPEGSYPVELSVDLPSEELEKLIG